MADENQSADTNTVTETVESGETAVLKIVQKEPPKEFKPKQKGRVRTNKMLGKKELKLDAKQMRKKKEQEEQQQKLEEEKKAAEEPKKDENIPKSVGVGKLEAEKKVHEYGANQSASAMLKDKLEECNTSA